MFPLALAASLAGASLVPLATSVLAQQEAQPDTEPLIEDETPEEGRSLMERGADMFLRGLRDEIDPTVQDLKRLAERMGPALQSFVEEMGPAMAELSDKVEDWTLYESPEMLPNGDILIRRREKLDPDAMPEDAPDLPEPGPGGEVEL
ncbi:hypothetical protein [Salipiger sp. CCB-MM3]|uniref:hypothetical protein n=1 Tax=Salipiger sp. CCB-MM3 TaxID=1792508 RepID=UPI000B19A965|nr:hypothetical protein [Salipiger sp. CCB-MM3]